MESFRLGSRIIGKGRPVYVILEAGSNWLDLDHAGDAEYGLSQAKKMIRAAKQAGADAVKFQIFRAADHISSKASTPGYLKTSKTLYDLIRDLELPRGWIKELDRTARGSGIDFLNSPCDRQAVEQLVKETDPPAFKLASFDIVDLDFIRFLASFKKPLILSVGMANPDEIRGAVAAARETGSGEICLLHCISCYPAPRDQVCLRSIEALAELTGLPAGFSDHTQEVDTAAFAVAAGACVIEKHFTLSRKQKGPDHPFALEPGEAAEMIRRIREAEALLGSALLGVRECERELHSGIRRGLVVAAGGIRRGETLQKRHFAAKRGDGLPPRELAGLLGRKAPRDFEADEIIRSLEEFNL